MRKIFQTLLVLFGAIWISGCEDKELVVINDTVAANSLNALSSTDFVLTIDESSETVETFKWTAPDFGFSASTTYTLQVDVNGNDFANAFDLAVVVGVKEVSVTVKGLNDAMLGLGLPPEEVSDMEFRVRSTINTNVEPVYSTTRTAGVTPFATIFPSIYGMGDALKGWGPWPGNAVEWPSSQLKKYSQIAYLTQGGAFRFFEQLDWGPTSYNYPYFSSVSAVFENANDGDSNFKVAAATGWYLVNVDLIAKTVTATATTEPLMYMTGDGIGGWDQPGTGVSVKMTFLRPGVFQATTSFYNDQAFRFFAQADWGPTSYNFPYFTTVDPLFVNANDGDSNLRYAGATGSQTVILDVNEKTVTVVPPLYMTGGAIGGWDQPGTGVSIKMTYTTAGTYQATTNFINGEAFRFFAQANWGPTSYNYPFFTTVDSDFENANDGDLNLKYIGTTGSRTVTVNLGTSVVTLD
jgi:hypothetical protein